MGIWEILAFGFAAILVGGALISIGSAIYSEHVLERWRRDPTSVPMDVVCKHIDREDTSVGLLVGCGGLVGGIIGLPFIFSRHGRELIGFLALAGVVAGFVVKMPFDFLFGPRHPRAPVDSLPPNGGGRLPYFAGAILKEPAKKADAATKKDDAGDDDDDDILCNFDTYKVFIAPTMLCAAETFDTVDDNGAFVDPTVFLSYDAASMFYDAFDVTSPDFRRLNEDNFQIRWRDIASLTCDPTPKPEKIFDETNSGSIAFHLKSGETREFVVMGTRDMAALQSQLQGRLDEAASDERLFDAGTPASS